MTIDELLAALHADGYLSQDNTSLNLPANNKLGSPPIDALLGNAVLFPLPQLVMAISQLVTTETAILIIGTIAKATTIVRAFSDTTAKATFTIDSQGVAELEVAVDLPDGAVLATAFPSLVTTPPNAAGAQAFTAAVLGVASAQAGPTMSFSGIPVPDPSIAGLWSKNPGTLAGPITEWSAPDTTPPVFNLATAWQTATIQAGFLPLQLQYALASDATAGGSGAVDGQIHIDGLGTGTIPLAMALPVATPFSPTFATSNYSAAVTDLSQLAPLFLGQQLANLVPSRFPIGNLFGLSSVRVGLIAGGAQTAFTEITVSAGTSIPLLPLNLADLTGIAVTFNFNLPNQFVVVFQGDFRLDGNASLGCITTFTLPGAMIQAYNASTFDVSELISIIPGLPELPQSGLTVETLSLTLSPYDMTYQFSGAISASDAWTISLVPGLTLLRLENLYLAISQSSSLSSVSIAANVVFLDLPLRISAQTISGNSGWIFSGTLNAESVSLTDIVKKLLPFPCQALPEIDLLALSCTFDSSQNTYALAAKVQWVMDILPITITADFALQSHRQSPNGPVSYSGAVIGELDINNLILQVSYVFTPTTTDITFSYKNLSITYHKDPTDPYVAISLNNSTVGDLFIFLLSFAEPGKAISLSSPWDALQKIGLPNLTVKVHLKTNVIEVDVNISINLGFIDVENFKLVYTRQYGKAKFSLQLSGNFLGQDYGKNGAAPLTWDPLNEAPPVVPGSGTQMFDLEYLGLGQHMTLRGEMPATMNGVITALENAMVPVGNPTQSPATQLPGLTYDSGSSWLIGTRFTAMSMVNLSLIFNDPNLYGLLIKLSGGKAGIFAGLQFEILYRKIADNLGVYHIELTLPDAMRYLQFGSVSITLPVVTVDIYTNGNFKVDVGFPPSLTNFSRSFSVQVFPFIGYGGFYFAVLNGQTSTSVPAISNGSFSPVLELGFALQVGVGKTISIGIMSGGISITVGGMLQGVFAWFNPTQQNLPSERFFHMTGTVAVVGMVYATVDFGIIQANVSLTVYASVSLDAESYKSVLISISAGVTVKVSIKILFIRISFSFSATITESFVIGSNQTTPWIIDSTGQSPTLSSNQYRRRRPSALLRHPPYSRLRARPARALARRGALLRRQKRLGASAAAAQTAIPVTAIPLVSQALAGDFSFPGGPAMSGADAPVLSLLMGIETSSDPTFGANVLMGFLLEWVVDALGHSYPSVSAALLSEVEDALKLPGVADSVFSYGALQTLFTSNNLVFTVSPRPTTDSEGEIPAAILPMPPEIEMSVPGYSIQFWNDRRPVGDYEQQIQNYFAELAAQFAARNTGSPRAAADVVNDTLAIFVFRYYFLMLCQNLVQTATNLLGDYVLNLSQADVGTATLTSVANRFNNDYTTRSGNTLASIATLFGLTEAQLAAANPQYLEHEPIAGQTVFVPATSVTYTTIVGDTLSDLSTCFGLSEAEIRQANPAVDFNNLQPGTKLNIPAMRVLHDVLSGETGLSIAQAYGISLSQLEAANPTVSFQDLTPGTVLLVPLSLSLAGVAVANEASNSILRAGTILALGDIVLTAQSSDSLSSLATQLGVSLLDLMTANSESQTLLNAGQTIPLGALSTTTREGDSFQGILDYWYSQATPIDPNDFDRANPGLVLVTGQTLSIPQVEQPNVDYTTQAGDTVASIAARYPAVTLSSLLDNNPLVKLVAGQKVSLPDVSPLTSNSYLFTYTAKPNDTLTSIAQTYFAPGEATQSAAVQSLQQWNGGIDPTTPLTVGTWITVPYISSLANLTRQYGVTLAQLAALPATVWSQSSLLAPRAQLTVPAVSHTIGNDESLGQIAQNYDLSVDQLADRIALTAELFASGGVQLEIKAIPGMNFEGLINAMATSGNFTNALNMTSRFMLSGLRLPAPQFDGEPPPPADTAYPMYALIGQELPLSLPLPQGYAFTLTTNGDPAWLSLQGGSPLVMPLDDAEIARISEFSTLKLNNGVTSIQPVPIYAYSPDRQPPSSLIQWNSPDLPSGLVPPGQKVAKSVIWSIPNAMNDALAASPTGQLPYQAAAGTTQSDGSVTYAILSATRYATIIDIDIQIPQNAAQGTYLVLGADQAGMARLLALWSHLQAAGSNASLYLAYPDQSSTNSTGIVVSDSLNRAQTFLIKTNLSTESHGPALVSSTGLRVEARNTSLTEAPIATLEPADALNFLQMLWELSVVKTGGYYLNYAKSDQQLGLPGTLFSVGQQATIQIVCVLDDQTSGDPVALSFNNAMLVGDAVDAAAYDLVFQAVTHTVTGSDTLNSIAADYPYLSLTAPALCTINQTIMGTMIPGAQAAGQVVLPNDTFATLASRAHLTPAALGAAIANQTALLQPGGLLQLAGTPAQIVAANDTLASISQLYDFLDPASLAALNEAATGLLAAGATMMIPGQPNYIIQPGDTFASIARAHAVDLSILAQYNADGAILAAGASILVTDNMLVLGANLPAGNIGFAVTRTDPQASDPNAETPQQALGTLFNLLGLQLATSDAYSASNEGLPAGPTTPPDAPAGTPWDYQQIFSLVAFAKHNDAVDCPGLPPPSSNPYAGIGIAANATIDLALQDVLGNRTENSVLSPLQQDVGYTDPILALTSWPSATLSYRFVAATGGNLHVAMTLAAGQYLPDDAALDMPAGVPSPEVATPAATLSGKAAAQYQTASYQLQQTDVTCSLVTSLGAIDTADKIGVTAQQYLLGTANSAYVYLTATSTLYPQVTQLGPTTAFLNLKQLVDPSNGYAVPLASLGKINSYARADLLWGQGTTLTVPYDYVTASDDTAQSISTRSRIPITVAQLAEQNSKVPLAGAVLIATADRSYTVSGATSLSLSAIAQQVGVQVPDGPGNVPGLATSNAEVALTAGLTLTYNSASLIVTAGQTLDDAAKAFTTATGSPVSVVETAMANQYLDGIFPAGTNLTVSSVLSVDQTDTLDSLAADFGPPPGQTGTPAEQMLLGNAEVPGIWPISTALFVANQSIAIALGDTLSNLALANGTTIEGILTDNLDLAFVDNAALAIPYVADFTGLNAALYAIQAADTLGGIADKFAGWNVTALCNLNADIAGPFNGTPIALNGHTVTPTASSTIAEVAAGLGLSIDDFAVQAAAITGILKERAALVTTPMATIANQTLSAVAAKYGYDAGTFAAANATLPDLLPSQGSVTIEGVAYEIYPQDTFGLLTVRINAARGGAPLSTSDVGNAAAGLTLKARTVLAAPLAVALDANVTPANASAILDLSVTLTLSRDPDCVATGFLNAPQVVSCQTAIPAQPFAAAAGSDAQSLRQFAADFEAAFAGLKLATGPNQVQGSSVLSSPSLKAATSSSASSPSGGGTKTLWVVNFSGQGTGFAYRLEPQLRYFAIPPLSTETWEGNRIAVPSYDSSSGLTWPPGQTQDFRSIDPDQWNQAFLAAVDLMLSPAYAVPGATNDNIAESIVDIIGTKATIASGLANTAQPIVQGDEAGLESAVDAMEQQLLVTLSSAYSVQTLVQADVIVTGSGASGDPATQPQLSGKLVAGTIVTPDDKDEPLGWVDPDHPFEPLAKMARVSQVYLANVIADMPSIIRPGLTASVGDKSYMTLSSDTVSTLAAKLDTDVSTLATTMTLAPTDNALFLGATAINVTAFQVPAGLATITLAAGWMDSDILGLLSANSERTDFFAPGSTVTLGRDSYAPTATDTLADVADHFGGMDEFARQVAAVDAGSAPGSYSLNAADPPHGLQVVPQLGFTTAKAPLSSTESVLTSLFSVKDPSIQKSTILALDYQVNQIEFDIHSVAGVQGYQSSSWLSFIIALENSPATSGDIGIVQIPIPLRGYPNPAVISSQSAAPPESGGDAAKTLAQWNYDFTVSRQFAAQDELTLSILFNQNGTTGTNASVTSKYAAVIQALAAFSVVWPAISNDLTQVPDIQNGQANQTAQNAVSALAQLTQLVANAWAGVRALAVPAELPKRTYKYQMSLLSQGATPYYTSVILERQGQTLDFTTPPDDFLFQYEATDADLAALNAGTVPADLAALFAANGFALSVDINLKLKDPPASNTDWMLFDESATQTLGSSTVVAPQTYRLLQQNIDKAPYAIQVWRQLLWPGLQYHDKWLNGLQMGTSLSFDLPDEEAYLTSPLELNFAYYRLNALLLQDAWGSSYVSRNANLLQGQTINSDFIYQTPPVTFPTQITPLITRSVPEPMTSEPDQTLAEALSEFFETLVAAQNAVLPDSTRNMRIGASYWQSADGISNPTETPLSFRNPLVLLPVYAFNVTTDWQLTDNSFCENLAQTIEANAAAMGIAATSPAQWVMDVLVYTYADPTLQPPPTPQTLLNLQNLTQNIDSADTR
jgi:LysM repeat protein